ncbi:MAG: hypothetical protein H6978_02140 [Gammaproteobacteria bacterium]|nr:hypothetical protein [Gammaproteobacteria bacterium]
MQDLHTSDTLGWRALMTEAQAATGILLAPEVESYLVRLLRRYVGEGASADSVFKGPLGEFLRHPGTAPAEADLAAIADGCLLLAGLLPDQAMQRAIPLGYLVETGRHAYREQAWRSRETLFDRLETDFIDIIDLLQTLRSTEFPEAELDRLTAYQLWADTGSRYAFVVLVGPGAALPALETSVMLH